MSVKVCEGLICPVYRDGSEMISITKDQGTQVRVHAHTPSAASLSTPSVVLQKKCSSTENGVTKMNFQS